ncbi:hypothetical protein [Desulfitibacter alkalitolerans]|uniref:hypothetical protein n=1 Tax=Desulfitibacter alkalitolerans TaxID=264641 RepID=UPI00048895CD|nr:hypothetical protein [Desulfitibacter alkalitolerans]
MKLLIVQFTQAKSREGEEKAIQGLLLRLILNGGNWPTKWLEDISHEKLKHTNTEPYCWAKRVYEKLIFKI